MIYLVGAILLTQTLIILFLAYMFLKVRSLSWDVAEKFQQYENFLVDLIKPQGDKPSKLVEFIDGVSANIATRIVSSAEAAIRGSAGGTRRAENADAIAANPFMSMLGGRLGKNPMVGALMQALLNKVAPSADNHPVPTNGTTPKFKL